MARGSVRRDYGAATCCQPSDQRLAGFLPIAFGFGLVATFTPWVLPHLSR